MTSADEGDDVHDDWSMLANEDAMRDEYYNISICAESKMEGVEAPMVRRWCDQLATNSSQSPKELHNGKSQDKENTSPSQNSSRTVSYPKYFY